VHKLLERQLRKHFPELPDEPRFRAFCAAVDDAYRACDDDRQLLERSIELASGELFERNRQLERDLASIKRLQLELRQAEKLRAVGQLAAGVAHEINTPIQYVGDSLHFLRESFTGLISAIQELAELPATEGAKKRLESIEQELGLAFLLEEVPRALEQTQDGIGRVAAIVSAMKDFGRPDSRQKIASSINRCVEASLLVAQHQLKHVADVAVELGPLPEVPIYPGELSQVILNLLVNAAHAVETRLNPSGQRGLIRAATRREGDKVVIEVADNGSGILPEHQSRIFEPFFTTKELGRGTGQGLAIAHSIVVEKHAGALDFETEVGRGTTFRIRLPVGDGREAA